MTIQYKLKIKEIEYLIKNYPKNFNIVTCGIEGALFKFRLEQYIRWVLKTRAGHREEQKETNEFSPHIDFDSDFIITNSCDLVPFKDSVFIREGHSWLPWHIEERYGECDLVLVGKPSSSFNEGKGITPHLWNTFVTPYLEKKWSVHTEILTGTGSYMYGYENSPENIVFFIPIIKNNSTCKFLDVIQILGGDLDLYNLYRTIPDNKHALFNSKPDLHDVLTEFQSDIDSALQKQWSIVSRVSA